MIITAKFDTFLIHCLAMPNGPIFLSKRKQIIIKEFLLHFLHHYHRACTKLIAFISTQSSLFLIENQVKYTPKGRNKKTSQSKHATTTNNLNQYGPFKDHHRLRLQELMQQNYSHKVGNTE